jgi:hypothetical protein
MILEFLEEAQAIYAQYLAEQKAAGRKHLDGWLTVEKDALRIVVHDYRGKHPVSSYYWYRLWFQCAGIHEIERPKEGRPRNGPRFVSSTCMLTPNMASTCRTPQAVADHAAKNFRSPRLDDSVGLVKASTGQLGPGRQCESSKTFVPV